MRAQHPDYVAAQTQKDRDERKAFAKRLAPAILVWLAAVLLIVLFYSRDTAVIIGLIASMWVITAWAGWYAHRATQADTASLESVARECRVCGATMDGVQMEEHLRTMHPEEVRYLKAARAYSFGVLAAIAALMLFLWYLLFPYLRGTSYRSFVQIVTYGTVFIWTGAMVGWRRFVDARHVRHVRRIWDSSHGMQWT